MPRKAVPKPQVKRRLSEEPASTPDASSKRRRIESTGWTETIEQLRKSVKDDRELAKEVVRLIGPSLSKELLTALNSAVKCSLTAQGRLAFYGASGTGKSQILNAMLGTEVLPAGGTGEAMTPVPIEIHYNGNEAMRFKYVVKHISKEVWMSDIADARNALLSGETTDNKIQCPIAKVRTVYAGLTDEAIKSKSVDEILRYKGVDKKLGTTYMFEDNDPPAFQESVTNALIAQVDQGNGPTWPLIESAIMYVNSDILKDGLVLVDVPGVQDSNPARTKKIKEYIHSATAVCIVAPASRAGSDEVLENLLEDALCQVDYAGRLDRVVLVSTKSDDFKIKQELMTLKQAELTEMAGKLGQVSNTYQDAKKAVDEYEQKKAEGSKALTRCSKDLTAWRKLLEKARSGETVHAPTDPKDVVDESRINHEISALEKKRLRIQANNKACGVSLRQNIKRRDSAMGSKSVLEKQLYRCIAKARLPVIKGKVKSVYDRKLQEHQNTLAAEDSAVSEGTWLPNQEQSTPAHETPVFCTSAEQFLILSGSSSIENRQWNYKNIEDTEIPRLREHLTKAGLQAQLDVLERNHNQLRTHLTSVVLFISENRDADEVRFVSPETATLEVQTAYTMLEELLSNVADCVMKAYHNINALHEKYFRARIGKMTEASTRGVEPKLVLWGTSRNEGGLFHVKEYQATVRRRGFWDKGTRGIKIDFNGAVAKRITLVISKLMASLYSSPKSKTKQPLNACLSAIFALLDSLHQGIRAHANASGVTQQAITKIDEQLPRRKRQMRDVFNSLKEGTSEVYLGPSRELSQAVKTGWTPSYDQAARVSGKDTMTRMHEIMYGGLHTDEVLQHVIEDLGSAIANDQHNLLKDFIVEVREVIAGMVADYKEALKERSNQARVSQIPGLDEVRSLLVVHESKVVEEHDVKKEELEDEDQSIFFKSEEDEAGAIPDFIDANEFVNGDDEFLALWNAYSNEA